MAVDVEAESVRGSCSTESTWDENTAVEYSELHVSTCRANTSLSQCSIKFAYMYMYVYVLHACIIGTFPQDSAWLKNVIRATCQPQPYVASTSDDESDSEPPSPKRLCLEVDEQVPSTSTYSR